ncbi:MAG TPA: hypothetical protein PKE16_06680, partial [Hyphomicrobium sp.]|nr:hypothetical protein [Hyphomicrobium sp.]
MTNLMNFTRSKSDPKIIEKGPSSATGIDRLAKSLAWFGIGLGAIELVGARRVSRYLGLEGAGSEAVIRTFGAREIVAGIMTLSTEKKLGLWARVAGDGLDMAALLVALQASRGQRGNVKLALLAVLGAAALDLYAAGQVSARSSRVGKPRNFSDRSGYPRGLESS